MNMQRLYCSFLCLFLCSTPLFSGPTYVEKDSLILKNGGGFQAVATLNQFTNEQILTIEALNYGDEEFYLSKSIDFKGPGGSKIFSVKPTFFNSQLYLKTLTRKNIDIENSENDLINIIATINSETSTKVWPTAKSIKNTYGGLLETNLIVGDSVRSFITFDAGKWTDKYKGYSSVDSLKGNFPSIGAWKLSENDNNEVEIKQDILKLSTNKQPVFFGLNKHRSPVLTVFPSFIKKEGGQEEAAIGINTDKIVETITVSGNFSIVSGSLLLDNPPGIVASESLLKKQKLDTGGIDKQRICTTFYAPFIAHNMVLMANVNIEGITDPYSMKVSVSELRGAEQIVMFFNDLMINGNLEVSKTSGAIQRIFTIPATGENNLYKACLEIDSDSGQYVGNQNQITVLGLPVSDFSAGIPLFVDQTVPIAIGDTNLMEDTTTQPQLAENMVSLKSGNFDAAKIIARDNYVLFTDGSNYLNLKADKIKADVYHDIDILQIIPNNINSQDPPYALHLENSSTDNSPTVATRFMVYQDTLSKDKVPKLFPDSRVRFDGQTVSRNVAFSINSWSINSWINSSVEEARYPLLLRHAIDVESASKFTVRKKIKPDKTTQGQVIVGGGVAPATTALKADTLFYTKNYLGKSFAMSFFGDTQTNTLVGAFDANTSQSIISDEVSLKIPANKLKIGTGGEEHNNIVWRLVVVGTLNLFNNTATTGDVTSRQIGDGKEFYKEEWYLDTTQEKKCYRKGTDDYLPGWEDWYDGNDRHFQRTLLENGYYRLENWYDCNWLEKLQGCTSHWRLETEWDCPSDTEAKPRYPWEYGDIDNDLKYIYGYYRTVEGTVELKTKVGTSADRYTLNKQACLGGEDCSTDEITAPIDQVTGRIGHQFKVLGTLTNVPQNRDVEIKLYATVKVDNISKEGVEPIYFNFSDADANAAIWVLAYQEKKSE